MQASHRDKEIQFSIVIPVYNEESALPHLVDSLLSLLSSRNEVLEIIFIDDGSTDGTSSILFPLCLDDARFQCVSFSRNFGHQLALTAGLKYARGSEAVFLLDGDLQDPPELFGKFLESLRDGNDIVYGIRNERKESGFKKFFYYSFYRVLNKISAIPFASDSGDFSLISRRVVDIINQLPEESRFLRGIRSWVGFKQTGLPYERKSRIAGHSKYSFRKLLRLATNGIYNFSELPIRLISLLGFLSITLSLAYFILTLINKFAYHTVPKGFTALLFSLILFSGVQLLSLGVIGEYVLRIFFQVKNRPLFIVERKIFDKEVTDGQ
jgi:polyisoprenyl-phosphate glycosyltransferase